MYHIAEVSSTLLILLIAGFIIITFGHHFKHKIGFNYKLSQVLSGILVVILSGVVTSAFGYQFLTGENPCPLCLLQRLGMIGVATGQLLNFRFGISMKHHAFSLVHCLFGGSVAIRQILLHICLNFPTFGTPVLGLSLFTWSFLVFVCASLLIIFLMAIYKPNMQPATSKGIKALHLFAGSFIFLIAVADIATTLNICGLGACSG